jgi:hypothetical protein
VSRLFPDRLLIGLAPAEMTVVRFRGWPRRNLVGKDSVACDPAFGAEPWQGAIAALKALELRQPCDATVVLSQNFVRYAVVPWSKGLNTAAEEDAYLRHHFAKIHGERTKAWSLRASESVADLPRLASAVDQALIDSLKDCFPKGAKARLISVQPRLMSKFNEWRSSIPDAGAWLVLAEPDRACVALHADGRWRSVQNSKGAWRALLERERYRMYGGVDGEIPNLVLIAGAAAPSNDADWQFRAMSA